MASAFRHRNPGRPLPHQLIEGPSHKAEIWPNGVLTMWLNTLCAEEAGCTSSVAEAEFGSGA